MADTLNLVIGIGSSVLSNAHSIPKGWPMINQGWKRINRNNKGLSKIYTMCVIIPQIMITAMLLLSFITAIVVLIELASPGIIPIIGKYDLANNLTYIIYITVGFIIVNAFIQFRVQTLLIKFLIWVTSCLNPFIKLNFGWIHANWHVKKDDDYYEISLNESNIGRLSTAIINQVAYNNFRKEDATPSPNIPPTDRANYLLLGNSVESRIHQYFQNDKNKLSQWWTFFEWCSQSDQNVFSSGFINQTILEGTDYYEKLKDLPDRPEEMELIEDLEINRILKENTEILSKKFKGSAWMIPKSRFYGNSMKKLFKRLRKFERYNDEHGENYIRLFFKQAAIRNQLWPDMKVNYFLQPYSAGIPVVLLNTEVISLNIDVQNITVDQRFQDLIAGTVSKVTKKIIETLEMFPDSPQTRGFLVNSKTNGEALKIADFVDFWFFSQGRNFCSKKTSSEEDISDCTLVESTGGDCLCDFSTTLWTRHSHNTLKRVG